MSSARPARLPVLEGAQAAASTPDRHVWLSASAGTGKTAVLAARVFRLLLRRVDPAAILALTFTKAGAAEMAGRINARLAAWVRLPEPDLRKDLLALGEDPNDPRVRDRARTLFARVLDAPGGGIRIQTIHGFCQGLLAAFPIEAGMTPGFRPLEAREETVLRREALADLLVTAEREGRAEPVAAVGALSFRLGEGGAEEFLKACARAPEAMAALPTDIQGYLRRVMDLPEGDIAAAIHTACGDDLIDRESLEIIARANREWGASRGVARAEAIALWLAADAERRAATLDDLHAVWATDKGTLRSFGKSQAPQDPAYADLATRLHGHCGELLSMRVRAAYADLLARGLAVGRDYALAYARAKRRVGAVDFDDLIAATVALLEQPAMGEWVRYKLDQTTEHILVDEAQDTNLRQWKIVDAMAGDFFAGLGGHGERARTLFTVGDDKQAIFGFQGTDPAYFRWASGHFERKADVKSEIRGLEPTPFARLSLTASYRSTRPVLEFVDAALAAIPAPGLGVERLEPHASEVPGRGRVELWPPVVAGDDEGEEGWADEQERRLATRIAREVKAWLTTGETLARTRAPIAPGDVMILVKRRGELALLLVARLHAEGVPVAGVDRLRLNAPLAVRDLLAAVRFALQPEDDLSLASLLVSPLIGWSQEKLLAVSVPRADGLWPRLQATCSAEDLAPLRRMLARVDIATPYQFLEELLCGPRADEDGGRRKLLARLGVEARDPIEELLNAALLFEARTAPSLQLFLDWFDRGDVEIKRESEEARGAVRVMTAHGAKGLQAPIVILADACVDPANAPRSLLPWSPEGDTPAFPVFRPRAAERGASLEAAVAEQDARELQEHWRLFYVAATRAEERLVIAGALGSRANGNAPAASWHGVADLAMTALGVGPGEGARVFTGIGRHGASAASPAKARPTPPALLPEWARRPAPAEARPPRPLAPSALGEDAVADPPPGPEARAAAERGRLIHALLERLPDVPPPARADAAERWLTAQGVEFGARREIIDAATAVMARFDGLFGPGALAEAPIAAVLPDGTVVSGTVDRLLVEPDRVRLVDFKTGRRAPAGLADVPVHHLRQMAAYAAAIGVIFPGRVIEAALLYTAGPTLIALPDATLTAHKPGLRRAEQS